MRIPTIAIPCAVLLSGYASLATQGPSDAAAPGIQPGQWEMTTEMVSVELPGAPEEIIQQMRASMAEHRQVHSQCITPEQARNPARNMTGDNPAGCTFSDTTWAGGIVRVRASCSAPETPPMELSIDGTYAARRIDGRIEVAMAMPNSTGDGAPARMRLGGRMTGRRTGDCTGLPIEPRPSDNSIAPAN